MAFNSKTHSSDIPSHPGREGFSEAPTKLLDLTSIDGGISTWLEKHIYKSSRCSKIKF